MEFHVLLDGSCLILNDLREVASLCHELVVQLQRLFDFKLGVETDREVCVVPHVYSLWLCC
jgi:hypothetical protein